MVNVKSPIGAGVYTGAVTRVSAPNEGHFKKGHPGGPGRPKGSRTKMQADLAQMILQGAADTGFMVLDDKGQPIPGEGGTLGYLRWCALNEPKTYMGMLTRVLPYHVVEEKPEDRILSREQAIEELKERGLPIEMLAMLKAAPRPLDPGEIEDPYGDARSEGEVTKVTEGPFGGTAPAE